LDAAAEGIKLYFDKALGSLLLYKFERQQYSEILKSSQNRPMSDLYGAEHLLRLLAKLPELIVTTDMEQDTVAVLIEGVSELIKYLAKNVGTLFVSEYNAATPMYIRMANAS
jgi:mortality factor 4-like protein 1